MKCASGSLGQGSMGGWGETHGGRWGQGSSVRGLACKEYAPAPLRCRQTELGTATSSMVSLGFVCCLPARGWNCAAVPLGCGFHPFAPCVGICCSTVPKIPPSWQPFSKIINNMVRLLLVRAALCVALLACGCLATYLPGLMPHLHPTCSRHRHHGALRRCRCSSGGTLCAPT